MKLLFVFPLQRQNRTIFSNIVRSFDLFVVCMRAIAEEMVSKCDKNVAVSQEMGEEMKWRWSSFVAISPDLVRSHTSNGSSDLGQQPSPLRLINLTEPSPLQNSTANNQQQRSAEGTTCCNIHINEDTKIQCKYWASRPCGFSIHFLLIFHNK